MIQTSCLKSLLTVLALGLTSSVFGAVEGGTGLRPLVAAFHVHSSVSTGGLSLDQLAEQAETLGLEAVILSDNFVLHYEYGVLPLRGVFRRTVNLSSVLDHGVEQYLAEVADVQARHPHVLLVPGIEVAPHYYWTGSLLDRNLTLHNSQKNLLVLGLSGAEDYAALPVTGNPASYRYRWDSALNLTPGLLFVPAAWLWRRRTYRTTRVGVVPHKIATQYRASALMVAGLALLLLLNAIPISQPVFSIYDDGLGYRPYQAVIDTVTARGGVAVWSLPEARDFSVHSFGPLGKVTIKTDPYPEALILTTGYAGFGGVYEDTRTATQPGGTWDQVIDLYLNGQRASPPFASGEVAFHGPGHDTKSLDRVLTVLWVRERTLAGLTEAMRAGRMYGVEQYRKEFGLRLDAFRVECQGGTRWAGPGETLDPQGARDRSVHLAVSATDHKAHPISVTIIRSGQVVARLAGETPFEHRYVDDQVSPEARIAYRLEIRGDGEILSNPIFVRPVRTG
ncbi:MAG: hypothetical protein AABZ22_09855 [Nitrospirota bacterium]